MTVDLVLAVLHHVAVFSLVGLLVSEAVLLNSALGPAELARLSKVDAAYGATAGIVVVIGVLRVIFGAKGWAYYEGNPWFWAKMASFGLIALLSIAPTIRFLAWQRRLKLDPAFVPTGAEVASAWRFVRIQFPLLALVLVFAATMARFS